MLWMYYFLTGTGTILFNDNLNPWDTTEKLLPSRCQCWSWGHVAAFLSEHIGFWDCLEEHQPRGALHQQIGNCQGLPVVPGNPLFMGTGTGALQHREGLSQVKVGAGVVAETPGCDRKLMEKPKGGSQKSISLWGFSETASKLFCQIEDGIHLAKLLCWLFFHCENNPFFLKQIKLVRLKNSGRNLSNSSLFLFLLNPRVLSSGPFLGFLSFVSSKTVCIQMTLTYIKTLWGI